MKRRDEVKFISRNVLVCKYLRPRSQTLAALRQKHARAVATLKAEHDKVVNALTKKCQNTVQMQKQVCTPIIVTFDATMILAIITTLRPGSGGAARARVRLCNPRLSLISLGYFGICIVSRKHSLGQVRAWHRCAAGNPVTCTGSR